MRKIHFSSQLFCHPLMISKFMTVIKRDCCYLAFLFFHTVDKSCARLPTNFIITVFNDYLSNMVSNACGLADLIIVSPSQSPSRANRTHSRTACFYIHSIFDLTSSIIAFLGVYDNSSSVHVSTDTARHLITYPYI